MKISIERKPKKEKTEKTKKIKTMHVGTHKKSVLILWFLLFASVTFAIYKNFTAIDQHTVHETKITEPIIVDTHAVESFTLNFIQDYYSWENKKEVIEQRTEKINRYLTSELQELNTTTIRSDIPTSSTLTSRQIWGIQTLDEQNFSIVYTVRQQIKEGKETKDMSSTYRVTVHQDKNGDLVITSNPTVWASPKLSEFQPAVLENDNSVDEKTKQEILVFLETFFKLYPHATKSELDYYMVQDTLPIINKNFIYSELVEPIIQKKEQQYLVKVAVRYLDSETKSENISQYQLILEKKENWKIVSNRF
ncbi:conjugal transfer protein [Enterococcus faecalis]|uniref:conjugal transfer protein n=1 Tax=Enterococcus faecalis TaxID=1351 RepID=UPI000A19D6B1|nr:conjugal transfer protein [Enterococcus faecalis]OSM25634.1 conjugal transfer protein [Enterococcus faecalis]OSM28833.1 conjugal transfer protein [Enterococcus faecalis]WPH48010.1 conjugal transfer protein [Enterococcus faecalis]